MSTQHTHGSNFGRHVEGCPRCAELKAGAAPIQWAKAAPKAHIDWQAHRLSCAACREGRVCTYGEW